MDAMGAAMTHDELLVKIDRAWKQYENDITGDEIGGWVYQTFQALRSVVKRHYPLEFHLGDVISEIQCAECEKKYPCKTIVDIEKELQ